MIITKTVKPGKMKFMLNVLKIDDEEDLSPKFYLAKNE